jgi:hypothetical protein
MIYCVVPEPLADELFGKLEAYYADDPNVTVIVDRRRSDRRAGEDRRADRRANGDSVLSAGRREVRDRRRARAAGDFPRIDPVNE